MQMLENQFVQKSSENTEVNTSVENFQESSGRVYFDSVQALADFESETTNNKPQTNTDPRVSKYLQNADVLSKHGEYNLALNLLRQACNIDSKNSATLSMLSRCLEKIGKHDEALVALNAWNKVDYGFESLAWLAHALYRMGRDEQALEKYFEALSVLTEEDDQLFEVYKNMGNIYVRQGDFDGAEEYYNKAYTINTTSDVLLVNFGTLEVQRGDFDKSLYCFRKAVEINPQNDKAWVGLAMVHHQFGDTELAWANIDAALDINKKNRTAVHLAANWGLRDRQLQKAIEALEEYLAQVEQDEDMSLVLINLFCTASQMDQALLEIERVLLWNPDHREVRNLKKKITPSVKAA
ncbi:lipopolysaccharide assembly protein LapB [Bdellovibrio sp. ZAP7]|uniref:tetratricopeptide repeat protein n=1 Tax=Bdellovibrio sp. ZAP7 TaxID=2231053 RepID=UPI001FEE9466|nr:tetratricopeptide repeat protein [Bdellovibrio sp. ZAP7]